MQSTRADLMRRPKGMPAQPEHRRTFVEPVLTPRKTSLPRRPIVANMIIITTPTGAIGHQVLESILRSDEPIRVIARDPSRLPSYARERIEVVRGSHSDAAVVNEAFAGAD